MGMTPVALEAGMNDYEPCARCGFDHGIDNNEAQQLHMHCEICSEEIKSGLIGEGPDHLCEQHQCPQNQEVVY